MRKPRFYVNDLNAERRRVVKKLDAIVAPHLRPSGWVDDSEPDGRLYIATWSQKYYKNREAGRGRNLKGFVLQEYWGFVKGGVLTDVYLAAVTLDYGSVPLEDLWKLLSALERRPPNWDTVLPRESPQTPPRAATQPLSQHAGTVVAALQALIDRVESPKRDCKRDTETL